MKALLLTAAAVLALASPAFADPFDDLAAVDDAVLDEARGGFVLEGGSVAGLGAQIRTLVDGQVALETFVTVGAGGVLVQDRSAVGLAPADGAQLQAAASRGLSLQGLSGQRVYLVADATAVSHRITGEALQNVIVNAGDGLDLRQEIVIDVALDAQALIADQVALAGLRVGLDQADLVRAGF